DALKVELALAQQFGQAELAAAEHARDVATAAGNEAEIRKANNQVIEQQVANLTRVAEIQKKIADDAKKTADAWAEPFKRAIDQVGSGIEGALKGIITARTAQERGQAWQGLNKSIVGTGIDLGGSLLSKGSAALLGAQNGQGIGDFLSGKLLGMLGLGTQTPQIALQTTANALLAEIAANTAATAVTSAAGSGTSALSAAGSLGGVASGANSLGLFGWIGSLFGGGGGASSAVTAAAVLSRGGIIPRAAGGWIVPAAAGGWSLPSSFGSDRVLSALTPGEMVLPTKISNWVQKAAGASIGGGGDVHVHVGAGATIFDGPSFSRYMQREGREAIETTVRRLLRGPVAAWR